MSTEPTRIADIAAAGTARRTASQNAIALPTIVSCISAYTATDDSAAAYATGACHTQNASVATAVQVHSGIGSRRSRGSSPPARSGATASARAM